MTCVVMEFSVSCAKNMYPSELCKKKSLHTFNPKWTMKRRKRVPHSYQEKIEEK